MQEKKVQGARCKVQDGKTVYGEKKQRKRWIPIFMGMTERGMGMKEGKIGMTGRDKTGRINPTPTFY